jgi:choline dehydrogenase-like flavoprotein
VVTGALVRRILLDNGRAIGVAYAKAGWKRRHRRIAKYC